MTDNTFDINSMYLPGYQQSGGLQYGQLGGYGGYGSDALTAATIKNYEANTASLNRQNQPLTGFAKGAQTFGTIAQGLQGLGSMYLGWQGMKQQKKEFEFNKGIMNTNMANSILDYNRRLGDTLANRAQNGGMSSSWVSDQLAKFSATRSP